MFGIIKLMNKLLNWRVYDISAETSSLNGVMLRGRIRKLGIEKGFNVLAENTEDRENGVRFAVLTESDADIVKSYLIAIADDISVNLLESNVINPVLSKLQVNIESRYQL